MKPPRDVSGMTGNERLYAAGMLDRFFKAAEEFDDSTMIDCLKKAWFSIDQAHSMVEQIKIRDGWPSGDKS
ncbi:MAG: hypothetical protein HKO13_02150 [Sphingomonas sp.]|nr:hypothetical protein [Sphingomonas sp.]